MISRLPVKVAWGRFLHRFVPSAVLVLTSSCGDVIDTNLGYSFAADKTHNNWRLFNDICGKTEPRPPWNGDESWRKQIKQKSLPTNRYIARRESKSPEAAAWTLIFISPTTHAIPRYLFHNILINLWRLSICSTANVTVISVMVQTTNNCDMF